MPDFEIERRHWAEGRRLVAGVDEAGRGCLAGPVVAAAAILPPDAHLPGLDDSKKLTAEQRETLYDRVHAEALAVGVGACSPAEVDELNVLWAAMEAMRRALADLVLPPDLALIDGNRIPPGTKEPAEPIIKGDAKSLSIAAASVIAKVTRDRLMVALDADFPAYGFAGHKGYPTARHYTALAEYGPTLHHRRTFRLTR
ncbi:MAG: ribonuclease HII [Bacteroidota bacterium]